MCESVLDVNLAQHSLPGASSAAGTAWPVDVPPLSGTSINEDSEVNFCSNSLGSSKAINDKVCLGKP